MKRTEINDFIKENNLLETCKESAGIYAITIDNYVAYIGQSKNIFQRCSQHIYNIENAGFNHEKKYELLLAAKLGGHKIDCHYLEYCGGKLNINKSIKRGLSVCSLLRNSHLKKVKS